MTKDKQQKEIEKLARELHDWYLEGTKELNPKDYNAGAQKSYDDLTEGQKDIDRFIAKKIINKLASYQQATGCIPS